MTLVTGIMCEYQNKECVLLTSDKAVSYDSRLFEKSKLRQLGDFKVVLGGSGYGADIEAFFERLYLQLCDLFEKDEEKKFTHITAFLKYSFIIEPKKLLEICSGEGIDGEVLLCATDENRTILLHIYANGRRAIEREHFVSIGIGADLVGMLMLKFLYNHKSPPTLDEAVRLAAVLNILASRSTRGVSSDFDCFALWNGKIGTLFEASINQVKKDANFIVHNFLNILQRIFFLPFDRDLSFMVRTEGEALDSYMKKILKKSAKKDVLIIDDMYDQQKTISQNIEKILRGKGLKSIVIKSRKEFKKLYKEIKEKIRFIILDRRIEHRETSDILKIINEEGLSIPVILLARGLKDKDVQPFFQKGISLYIAKEDIEKEPGKIKDTITGLLGEGDYQWKWV